MVDAPGYFFTNNPMILLSDVSDNKLYFVGLNIINSLHRVNNTENYHYIFQNLVKAIKISLFFKRPNIIF
jgi:hypothetical protein